MPSALELAHFVKFFMKNVTSAITKFKKWSSDIEPFAFLDEAWFSIKGIPLKYRNISNAFYVATC
jgi:hypothetical protein